MLRSFFSTVARQLSMCKFNGSNVKLDFPAVALLLNHLDVTL